MKNETPQNFSVYSKQWGDAFEYITMYSGAYLDLYPQGITFRVYTVNYMQYVTLQLQ